MKNKLKKLFLFLDGCKGHEMIYLRSTIEKLPYTNTKGCLDITYKERVVEHYQCKYCPKKSEIYRSNEEK